MEELIECTKRTLADTFAFYLKAHYFHWNIEGPDFFQYHKMLEGIYEDVYGAVDPLAEFIRTLSGYAPGSFARYMELSTIPQGDEEDTVPSPMTMITRLELDNQFVIASIERCYELAEQNHEHGLSNFLAEREGQHKKHRWFLRATLNKMS